MKQLQMYLVERVSLQVIIRVGNLKESPLRDLAIEKYETLFGKKAVIEAIHAGLECGFWDGKMENVDIISMGPDMMDVHTVKERVSKQSIDNVWKLLKEIVEAY